MFISECSKRVHATANFQELVLERDIVQTNKYARHILTCMDQLLLFSVVSHQT